MIIDIHSHIWHASDEYCEKNLMMAEKCGIDRVYVSALSSEQPTREQAAEGNAAVARFIKRYPERLGGFVYISPEHGGASEIISRAIEEQGFSGIKIWVSALCDSPCLDEVAQCAIRYGVPLLLHVFKREFGHPPNVSTGLNVARLARRYPEAKIIMAHLGGNCYDALPLISDLKNVWTDISGTLHHGNELSYAKKLLGARRILFGTDLVSFHTCYGQVAEASLTDSEREDILYKNAERVLNTDYKAGDLLEQD